MENVFETIQKWIPGIVDFGIHLIAAILILAIGYRLINVVRKILKRSLERAGVEVTLRRFLDALVHAVLIGILVFMAAEQIGFQSSSIIAVLGSAGLALGLALQGSLANFAGGVLILLMKPFRAEDYIVTSAGEGTVFSIGLVYTTLITPDNRKIVIPNGSLANSSLTNVTAMDKRRLDMTVGIGYDSDIRKAKEVLQQLFGSCEEIIKEDGINVFVDNLGDSSVVLGVRAYVPTGDYWKVRWRMNEEIKLAFDREGIEIPYNYMNVVMTTEK